MTAIIDFLRAERSGTRVEFLAPALMVAGLAYSLIHNLGWMAACDGATAKKTALLPLPLPLAAGMAGEKIVTARNIARETGILPGRRKEIKKAKTIVQEPTGPSSFVNHTENVVYYHTREREGGPVVYVPCQPLGALAELPHMPKDLARALQDVPAEAQPMLAAICTLFLEQVDDITKKYHQKNPGMTHGAIKTSLRELAERMGLSPCGKNFRMIAEMLGLLVFTHAKDFVIGYKRKKEKTEEIVMAMGRFITWIEYRWKKDRPFDDITVGITICPALTDFLLSPECQSQLVWVPVNIIKKLRRKTRRSRYSIPALFYIMAAKPGKGKPFRIGWEKMAEKILPGHTESGRKIRPSEKRELVRAILGDIAETGVIRVEEESDGVFTIHYPQTHKTPKLLTSGDSNI
ncbi:hypothetical protein [Neomoorella mulderi]|uniref:Uncharacterized protein n=1 Tax=Moorella mulderi DSM 14980 TaxID=1122241 RepID=A0A151B088_9FIRM|nr:hypothetical protein [Moorella mulderi]KYH33306.1 hypothetical protein MOMUL_00070 [Moorella mulderi DSM 14980]